ncbi:Cmx/CmrA family chloramphenicol efflux MFS transporter [Amycolatopsis sp. NPDC049252]|uniref:Cmx/CmrA family chloramphenicol efflux MFS transporter n=1 Tax=Amycolatopsis sp. NPDC049252 TaxID=3363933 RepID=UPI003716F890
MPVPVFFLALAVFAMGTSEFMLAGLVPQIAGSLGVSLAQAGLLTSAFAAGLVVGAPLMAAVTRSWRRRTALLCFLAAFGVMHIVGGLTESFAVLLVTRLPAAVAYAGFLAVALTAAAELVPPERTGRALAVLLGGTTIACVVGIPGGALLGAAFGWRAAFWAVALLCVTAVVGLPDPPVTAKPFGLRTELAELRRPLLAGTLLLGALVNAATFGVFTYLAPLAAGLAPVPLVLALFGVGCFAGVSAAGRLADRWPGRVVVIGGLLLLAGWVVLALVPAALPVLAFPQGALSFAVGGTVIARILRLAPGAPTMAGSYATAALNVGAAAGPVLGAVVAPVWLAVALVAVALVLAVGLRSRRR